MSTKKCGNKSIKQKLIILSQNIKPKLVVVQFAFVSLP